MNTEAMKTIMNCITAKNCNRCGKDSDRPTNTSKELVECFRSKGLTSTGNF